MREQRTLGRTSQRVDSGPGNGVNTLNLIADGLEFEVDPQVTGLQIWNVLLANLRSLDVVGSLKHELYPQGFTGVVLLLDGHVAAQYTPGLVNVTICSNSGHIDHEKLRSALWLAFDELQP